MAITGSNSILAQEKQLQESEAPASNWVKDLLDKRYQPQQKRIKRNPVGFEFKRDPFDPSSYYKALGSFRDISRAATNVVRQEVANHEEAQREREFSQSQDAMMKALGGVNPNFTYSNASYNGGSHNYGLKGISPTASKAANYFGGKYGIKNIGGRGPGSVPGSDHPKGRALDFMTYKNMSKGTSLANDVIKNYKAWNVKYVIWNHYIWQPGRGWNRYHGPSPHTDHVHVSFNK